MDAKKLEILMTAVDLGSFSKASQVVGYTQSGLTHLVNSLEREIGLPLIKRSHNGISLTRQRLRKHSYDFFAIFFLPNDISTLHYKIHTATKEI